MQKLIDGDLASNNGGWQWSASTGTDAAPYFRIFNAHTQSTKADPTGIFIKRYVPELAKLHGAGMSVRLASANSILYSFFRTAQPPCGVG